MRRCVVWISLSSFVVVMVVLGILFLRENDAKNIRTDRVLEQATDEFDSILSNMGKEAQADEEMELLDTDDTFDLDGVD